MNEKLRYERKFVIDNLSKKHIEAIIKKNNAMFKEIYYERQINNIYWDTIRKQSFKENDSGISERKKIRVRWYGNLIGEIKKPVLELKNKHNKLTGKKVFKLKSFQFNNLNDIKKIKNEIIKTNLVPKNIIEKFKWLKPSLINSYVRKYFLSIDRKYRITIDTDLKYYDLKGKGLNKEINENNKIVVELKYNPQHGNEVERITNQFPFRLYKNSKYATGIELLKY